MPDPQVINTLNTKADGLRSHIARTEKELDQTRAALSHVLATIHLFEAPEDGSQFPMHYNLDRLFKRREVVGYCKEALESGGVMSTRQLTDWIIEKKGFPNPDRHLQTSIAYRVVQALRLQDKHGGPIKRQGKNGNAILWVIDPKTGC